MTDKIMVSICCLTFNHEKYIEQTLLGFVNQKTDFLYEVLINDDASTDRTPEIIRKYAELYPDIIKPIYQTENQYSQGIAVSLTYNYPRVKGKYVAFCEGDDYWCDNNKLQKQFEALERRPDCSICVHNTQWIDKNGNFLKGMFPQKNINEGVIPASEYIHTEIVESPWFFQMTSYFIRKEVIEAYLNGFRHPFSVGDLPLVLLSLEFGDCYYIKEVMSCYRKDSGGAMTSIRNSREKTIKQYESFINGYKFFDERTKGKYSKDFQYGILFSEVQILKSKGEFRKILNKKYKQVFRRFNTKNKILTVFGAIMPNIGLRIYEYFHMRNRNGC